ncbi:MAG: RNA polymerase sigma factor [Phycisphaerae bacterium]
MNENEPAPGCAWAAFFLEHHRALTAYALALVGRMEDAEDLIQDVLLKMVRSRQPVKSARPFVMRCLRNLAVDRHRSATRRPPPGEWPDCGVAFLAPPARDAAERDRSARARAALEQLPPPQLEVIVLKVYAGLTFLEIAETVDKPIGTVTSHYRRGLEGLRERLCREVNHA